MAQFAHGRPTRRFIFWTAARLLCVMTGRSAAQRAVHVNPGLWLHGGSCVVVSVGRGGSAMRGLVEEPVQPEERGRAVSAWHAGLLPVLVQGAYLERPAGGLLSPGTVTFIGPSLDYWRPPETEAEEGSS